MLPPSKASNATSGAPSNGDNLEYTGLLDEVCGELPYIGNETLTVENNNRSPLAPSHLPS
jgi:hypothetical protein